MHAEAEIRGSKSAGQTVRVIIEFPIEDAEELFVQTNPSHYDTLGYGELAALLVGFRDALYDVGAVS